MESSLGRRSSVVSSSTSSVASELLDGLHPGMRLRVRCIDSLGGRVRAQPDRSVMKLGQGGKLANLTLLKLNTVREPVQCLNSGPADRAQSGNTAGCSLGHGVSTNVGRGGESDNFARTLKALKVRSACSMQGSCRPGQPKFSHHSKFINYDLRRQARSPLKIFCDEGGDFGGDYFSSGEQHSDGEASPGGSPSGSGSESERETTRFDFFDESSQTDTKRIDFAAPFVKSSALGRHTFTRRIGQGILATAVLSTVLFTTVLTIDSYIWRVIRRPLVNCFLTGPFCIAAAASAFLGSICVPLLQQLKTHQVFRIEGPAAHQSKIGTPTLGGLYFIPVGVGVARLVMGYWSAELWGVCMATLAFGAIGFADDWLALWRKHNYGMPGSLKFLLQVAVGVCFVFWLDGASLQSPYKMSRLLPLPAPFGLLYLGKWYLPLTAFCFAAMSNGVNLTDGLDGLAAGTCAAAYIGMAVAVLPIYPGLGIFGASMAGACIGFLTQNRYKAKVFMGDTGSLALGGGLAAMAACTGMFLPLFVASGVFIIETVSVMIQVSFFKLTKRLEGKGRQLLRMSPFHHHLELGGWTEPAIIAAAYLVAYILAIAAAHTGLISA